MFRVCGIATEELRYSACAAGLCQSSWSTYLIARAAREIFDMAKTLIVSGVTALLLGAFGVFWMFMWLVGTNGYNGSTGGAILACNLALVILSIIISSVASGWLTNKLGARLDWPT
jgi:sugar phosphate permease